MSAALAASLLLACTATIQAEPLTPAQIKELLQGRDSGVGLGVVEAAAESGDPNAQLFLALLYLGEGKGSGYAALADKWLHNAAESGSLCAMTMLGVRGLEGAAAGIDELEAIRWLQQAASHGAPMASKILLTLHNRGEHVSQDEAEVAAWQSSVATSPGPRQRIETAEGYLGELSGPPDLVEAYKWTELALLASDDGTEEAGDAIRLSERLVARMSAEQIAEARRKAEAWKVEQDDECAILIDAAE